MTTCVPALVQFNSRFTLVHANRSRVPQTCSHKLQLLEVTRFTGLRREVPPRLKPEERTRQWKGDWWEFTERFCDKGSGLKPVLVALSGFPDGNLGLYDPALDMDSCGVGFVAELSAQPNRKIVSAIRLFSFFREFLTAVTGFIWTA